MASSHPGDSSNLGAYDGGSSDLLQDNHEDGGRWYFSRKEIEENSPSRQDGIDLKKETYLRKSYCTFLQDLGMRLKVPQVTIATAITFCHRFYLRQSHAKNDRRTIVTACMFLAGKVEETPRPLKDVILVSYQIIHKRDPDAGQKIKQKEVYEQQKELIVLAERVVLATLGFDLNVQHPYKPLVDAIKNSRWPNILSPRLHGILSMMEVSNQMLELYEQNKLPHSQGNEAENAVGKPAKHSSSRGSTEDHLANGDESLALGSTQPGTSKAPPSQLVADHEDSHGARPQSTVTQNDDYRIKIMNVSEPKGPVESRVVEPTEQVKADDVQDDLNVSISGNGAVEEGCAGENRAGEGRELKDTLHNPSMEHKEPTKMYSQHEVLKTIDGDRLKELRERRKKSRGDAIRRKDSMDEYDLIVKELEDGVELAAASEKIKLEEVQSWSQPSSSLENHNSRHGKHMEALAEWHHLGKNDEHLRKLDVEVVEREVSARDDSSRAYTKKRKARSPAENGKQWHDSLSGPAGHCQRDLPEDMMLGRPGYADRDRKRQMLEGHS
ncbi:hypothetical protein Dimus_020836 [Dionaea muscipula]